MSDILKAKELELKKLKKLYLDCETYYISEKSSHGTSISLYERQAMDEVASKIAFLEKEIAELKLTLKNITAAKVIRSYDTSYKELSLLLDNAREHYGFWHLHIMDVGTAYQNAMDSYSKIVKEQNKHEADINALFNSILSLVGLSALSWLSDTGKLANVLTKASKEQINVLEDAAQGFWDKSVSLGAINVSTEINIPAQVKQAPLAFQNKLHREALKNFLIVCKEISTFKQKCSNVMTAIHNRDLLGKGDAKTEYEIYLHYKASLVNVKSNIETWMSKTIPSPDYIELEKDFERRFWAHWLPGLRKIVPIRSYRGPSNAPPSSTYTEYDTWWICDPLRAKLKDLIDLDLLCIEDYGKEEAIGNDKEGAVGEDGLGFISERDVMCLVEWADNFNMTQKF